MPDLGLYVALSTKKNQSAREKTDSRFAAGEVQDKPGASCARKQGSAQRMMGTCQRDTGAS